jgi:hypothetical protein
MANQTASPHEAEVARRMLSKLKPEPQRQEPQADPFYTRWAAEDFNTSSSSDLHFDAVWNSTTHRYEPRIRYRPYATYDNPYMSYNDILRRMQQAQDMYEAGVRAKWYSRAQTSNPAPDERYYPPGSRGEDPLDTDEPIWMSSWWRKRMKQMGMDDDQIDDYIKGMK